MEKKKNFKRGVIGTLMTNYGLEKFFQGRKSNLKDRKLAIDM